MSKHLKILQQEWYDKIKQDGFKDIEKPSGRLSNTSPKHKITISATLSYFDICQDFLNRYYFTSDLDLEIWQLHCEGFSRRQTARILKINPSKVRYRLDNLKMVLKYWRTL